MSVLELADVEPLLICPCCGSNVKRISERYLCINADCRAAKTQPFPIIGKWPVLVDFQRSILVADQVCRSLASSPIARKPASGVRKLLQGLTQVSSGETAKNVDTFLNLLKSNTKSPVILVVGGGSLGHDVEKLYNDPDVGIIAFDIYGTDLVQFVADGHQIPLKDCCVDGVLIQAVLEHVLEPAVVVSEIYRVLRPGGCVYSEIPFLQQVHEGPYDFTRFTVSGHRYLYRNFTQERSGATRGTGVQALWTIDHLVRGVFRSVAAGKLAKVLFFWVAYLDRLIPARYQEDSASGTFFLGRKANAAILPSEMVATYTGAQQVKPFRDEITA